LVEFVRIFCWVDGLFYGAHAHTHAHAQTHRHTHFHTHRFRSFLTSLTSHFVRQVNYTHTYQKRPIYIPKETYIHTKRDLNGMKLIIHIHTYTYISPHMYISYDVCECWSGAVCCSVLQCVAVCCNVWQCVQYVTYRMMCVSVGQVSTKLK